MAYTWTIVPTFYSDTSVAETTDDLSSLFHQKDNQSGCPFSFPITLGGLYAEKSSSYVTSES